MTYEDSTIEELQELSDLLKDMELNPDEYSPRDLDAVLLAIDELSVGFLDSAQVYGRIC